MPLIISPADVQPLVLFRHLPKLEDIVYKGEAGSKVRHFKIIHQQKPHTLLTVLVISNEDRLFWDSCADLVARSVQAASLKMRGIFGFDLLAVDIHQGMDVFNWDDLGQLLVNHSRKLACGQERLVRYCSLLGVLTKKVDVDWGKVGFRLAAQVYTHDPQKFDLFVRKLLKAGRHFAKPVMIVICDLSREPLLDPRQERQTVRLGQLFRQQPDDLEGTLPQVYVIDQGGCHQLNQDLIA